MIGDEELYPSIDVIDSEKNRYGYISRSFQRVNTFLQAVSILVNLFHLFILTRQEMRSIPVHVLMIGICFSDIILTYNLFYTSALEMSWIPQSINQFSSFFVSTSRACGCLSLEYVEVLPSLVIYNAVTETARLTSIYLSILMAVYRTLSVMFPMSNGVQNISNIKSAVISVIGTVVYWLAYSLAHLVHLGIISLQKFAMFCPDGPIDPDNPKPYHQGVIFVLPDDVLPLQDSSFLSGLTKAIPAIVYPVITVFLIIELRRIRARRRNMKQSSASSSDSTTMLVFFMTVTFMLSEGLAGAVNLMSSHFSPLIRENDTILVTINMFNHPVAIAKTLNAMSHTFVCILMSSQYRDTVKSIFCRGKRLDVIMVREATSTGQLKSKTKSF